MTRMRPQIAVVGAGEGGAELLGKAEQVGAKLAEAEAVLVCGGLGGVMEAACRGAREAGGLTVGLLPGTDRGAANQFLDVAVPTGMGEMRNALIVRAADAVLALGGGHGTLSEIAFALKIGRPVVGFETWELSKTGVADETIVRVDSAEAAVTAALRLAKDRAT